MKRETSLARRIVAAFVMMTVVVAGLFSLTVLMAVSHTEENYSSYTMNKQLDDILNALERGLPFHLDQDMALYVVGADGQPQLPAWLGPLRPGFQEAYRGGPRIPRHGARDRRQALCAAARPGRTGSPRRHDANDRRRRLSSQRASPPGASAC
jgi:hypothetical protein